MAHAFFSNFGSCQEPKLWVKDPLKGQPPLGFNYLQFGFRTEEASWMRGEMSS